MAMLKIRNLDENLKSRLRVRAAERPSTGLPFDRPSVDVDMSINVLELLATLDQSIMAHSTPTQEEGGDPLFGSRLRAPAAPLNASSTASIARPRPGRLGTPKILLSTSSVGLS